MKIISNKSISLTERTQSISARLKVPMTLYDFKKRYNELLNFHLNEYIDHSELTFAQMWTDSYSSLSSILQKSAEPELLTAIEKRGLEALGKKQYYHNLELSFNEISKFLKQRMKLVKKELKTKLEPSILVEIVNPDAVKKQPDTEVHFSVMNDAISSLNLALIEDRKTSQKPEADPINLFNTLEFLKQPFINEFDHVPTEKVYNYFKVELVDTNYLSLDDLDKYLIKAFQEKIKPAEKFVFKGDFSIGIIVNIFYRYYKDIMQDRHGSKDEYCRLLGEYFNGFDTDKVNGNFK
jgi:hypothetical protein